MLADYYVLIHKSIFVECIFQNYKDSGVGAAADAFNRQNRSFQAESGDSGSRELDKISQYCHKHDHWKADCYMLKGSLNLLYVLMLKAQAWWRLGI